MNNVLKLEDFKANTKEWFLEQLFNMSAIEALQTISDLSRDMFKPKFPKTYGECCRILNTSCSEVSIQRHKEKLIGNFQELLICRDAYWKIAGDWTPDWSGNDGHKYGIYVDSDRTIRCTALTSNTILIFPTEEMRDVFEENFKDLIERCKELL